MVFFGADAALREISQINVCSLILQKEQPEEGNIISHFLHFNDVGQRHHRALRSCEVFCLAILVSLHHDLGVDTPLTEVVVLNESFADAHFIAELVLRLDIVACAFQSPKIIE